MLLIKVVLISRKNNNKGRYSKSFWRKATDLEWRFPFQISCHGFGKKSSININKKNNITVNLNDSSGGNDLEYREMNKMRRYFWDYMNDLKAYAENIVSLMSRTHLLQNSSLLTHILATLVTQVLWSLFQGNKIYNAKMLLANE